MGRFGKLIGGAAKKVGSNVWGGVKANAGDFVSQGIGSLFGGGEQAQAAPGPAAPGPAASGSSAEDQAKAGGDGGDGLASIFAALGGGGLGGLGGLLGRLLG